MKVGSTATVGLTLAGLFAPPSDSAALVAPPRSVERFYTAPLVYNMTCSGTTSAQLTFTTANNFKQNNLEPGRFTVYDETAAASAASTSEPDLAAAAGAARTSLADGKFDFVPHWRQTEVRVDLGDISASGAAVYWLHVINQWGDITLKNFTCAPSGDADAALSSGGSGPQ